MDDMEDIKDDKNSPYCLNSISTTETGIKRLSKSTCPINSNDQYKEINSSNLTIDSSVTSSLTDSSSIKVVKSGEKNQLIELESSDDKVNFVENSEAKVKLEESSFTNIVVGVAPAIGVPLARSSPISREFVALQKSLNESKILTEFVTDTSAAKAARKGRKSHFGNSEKRENSITKNSSRNRSEILDISNDDRNTAKRFNMRSQNSEFAQKHMDFLSRVMQQQQSGDEQYASETEDAERYNANTADDDDERHTVASNSSAISSDLPLHDLTSLDVRLKGIWQSPPKRGWDSFCWRCRECAGSALIPCSKCLRCFHKHCIKVSSSTKLDNSWNCPECLAVENALSSPKKTRRPELTLDMLSELLSFALKRMRTLKGNSKFLFADSDLSSFSKYIVNPVTFTSLEEKISKKAYRCPEEFYNETKWMVHNAHILTTGLSNNKLVVTAKSVLKVCRQEANEIETCPGCYLSANTRSDWFVDVCAQPHLLLWAKLKGFPYWPAKAMGVGQNAVVNVRFFGKHDRAFVPIKDCFLFSEQDPNTQTGKRSARELADCIKEVEIHIKKIETKIGKFNYAPFKTPYDPTEEQQQLEFMMPGVAQYTKRQQAIVLKPSLQYKIVKTADNNLSIIKKANSDDNGKNEIETTHDLVENIRKESSKTSASSSDSSKHLTSKYEVITKTVSNDSNSPKVNAVILKKRKSLNFSNNNESNEKTGSEIEASSAKISKNSHSSQTAVKTSNKTGSESSKQARMEIDQTTDAVVSSNNSHGTKRKQDVAELSQSEENDSITEKHKAKHSRSEPRLPILTIKAGSAKIVETTAREVVENFAKSNTCVTIKKISKSTPEEIDTTNTSSSGSSSRATRSSVKDPANVPLSTVVQNVGKEKNISTAVAPTIIATKSSSTISTTSLPNESPNSKTAPAQAKTDKDRSQQQHDRNIFRELVPFVEIKQEVNSDEETEEITPNVPDIEPQNISTTQALVQIPEPNIENPPTQEQNTPENIEPMLTKVKEEAISDEEAVPSADIRSGPKDAVYNSTNDTPMKDLAINNIAQVASTGGSSLSVSDGSIRVVGDTTIQRVSVRNAAIASTSIPQSVAQVNFSSATTTATLASTLASNTAPIVAGTTQSKRGASRSTGVPFGPLPASASSNCPKLPVVTAPKITTVTETTIQSQQILQQQQQQQQLQQLQSQRARKSFPNRSPPGAGTTSFPTAPVSNALQGSGPCAPIISSSVGEGKRGGILKSTSMVSIPADIAAQRNINHNSIPMPPLTAVSKTTPVISSITNSIAASNSPSTSPNSNNSLIGTITPAAFANTGNSGLNKNTIISANTTTPQSSTVPMVTSNSNPTQTQTQNQSQSQKMTAPPPLAGLSYTNVNTAISSPVVPLQSSVLPPVVNVNVSLPSGNNANLPITNTDTNSSNATENHLLGDFVTPALANAITEVICRGPPKMARRPNGPLQSDGSTMFPSSAGPVCRTLVQNAHKLTDFFISVMEDTMCDMSNSDEPSLQAKITLLTMELERLKQAHEQEIAELKRTSDLMLCEMRKSMENEKSRIANEIRKQCELERLRCVEETKRKQWCANCGREAQFYCCWNTSYCDYPCQQQHWGRHAATCAQTRANDAPSTITSSTGSGMVNHNSQQHQQQQQQPVLSASSTMNTHAFNPEARNKTSNMNSGTMNINIQYNKNVSSSKKDKQSSASSVINNKNSMNIPLPPTNAVTSDALKLPTNTYLRPVGPNSNGSNSRSSGFNSTTSSRYNISLPMKSAGNPTTPYTIVQRGSSWELLTTSSNTNPINTINTVNALGGVQSTNTNLTSISNTHQQPPQQQHQQHQHQHQQHQQQHQQHQHQQHQQQRSATMPTIVNKVGGRNRGTSNMVYAANSNGNMRATKM